MGCIRCNTPLGYPNNVLIKQQSIAIMNYEDSPTLNQNPKQNNTRKTFPAYSVLLAKITSGDTFSYL